MANGYLWAANPDGHNRRVINRDSATPPFEQLAGILRAQIVSGELARGERLPTILDLSVKFEVAQLTVRKAVQVLKDEGLVVARAGWGTFVAED
jgi:GntR family transcriptional regulator